MLLVLAGCGKARTPCVPVAGQVFLDGKPLPMGFIRVIPEKGRAATATLDAEGRFHLSTFNTGDGCIRGTHAVEVIAKQSLGKNNTHWVVPEKYGKAATSGLKVTIDKATDSLRIDLVSDVEKR